jgi:hypothetical protein
MAISISQAAFEHLTRGQQLYCIFLAVGGTAPTAEEEAKNLQPEPEPPPKEEKKKEEPKKEEKKEDSKKNE